MPETLLRTKLFIPPVRPNLVARHHLIEQLKRGLQLGHKLTLVSAPAGFGKTTLVANWGQQLSEADDWHFSWLSLDENDNEVARFFTYFVAALQEIDGRFGQSTIELLQSSPTVDVQLILTDLLNSLAHTPQNLLLALDDFYHITNQAIHDGIQFLLDHAPPGFHLLLMSRSDPPLSLARLRAGRQMIEVRQDDLRFAPAEARQFLNQLMALELPESAITALEKRTEGWIAGLQMAALSLHGHPEKESFISDFTGSHRYIFDYLTEEVLAGQSAETREFLLQTSVLDRLCAPLCDTLLNQSQSQQILEQLEGANLFLTPLDDERRWYHYHQLFADLLRQQLRREQPGLERALHRRASQWFEKVDFADEAVQHALAGADHERAATLVAQYSQSLVHHGEINKLLSWIGRLPAEQQRRHPQLIFNHAWALLFRSGPEEMTATLSYLPDEVANSLPYSVYLLVMRGLVATRQGRTDEALALAEEAEARLTALEPSVSTLSMRGVNAIVLASGYRKRDRIRAEELYQTAASLCRESGNLIVLLTAVRDRGTLLLEQGQLHQAEAVFLKGIQFEQQWVKKAGSQDRKMLAAAPIHVSLAQLCYEWNRLDEAESHLVDSLRLLAFIGPVSHSEGLAALARLRLAQGDLEAVRSLLTQLEGLQDASSSRYQREQLAITIMEAHCALYQQEPSAALGAKLEQSLPALGDGPTAILVRARVLLTLARPAEAGPLLETLADQLQEEGRQGFWLSAILLRCLAQQRTGEPDKALQGMRRALLAAEPQGYIRLFLDIGQPMANLLQRAARQDSQPGYARKLLSLFGQNEAPLPSPLLPGIELLSPRETEVLQLIAQGLTNREIANKLVIAPSTAKRHTVNIYNKLGVSNRAEATAKAYELGLVNLV